MGRRTTAMIPMKCSSTAHWVLHGLTLKAVKWPRPAYFWHFRCDVQLERKQWGKPFVHVPSVFALQHQSTTRSETFQSWISGRAALSWTQLLNIKASGWKTLFCVPTLSQHTHTQKTCFYWGATFPTPSGTRNMNIQYSNIQYGDLTYEQAH